MSALESKADITILMPKARIKRTKTSLGWAYRVYVDGNYVGTESVILELHSPPIMITGIS
jgi:hypothetical protein